MKNAWDEHIQNIWLQTGAVADQSGIVKWGIVTPEGNKGLTISYLVKGGKEGKRSYDHFISQSEDEVLEWARN